MSSMNVRHGDVRKQVLELSTLLQLLQKLQCFDLLAGHLGTRHGSLELETQALTEESLGTFTQTSHLNTRATEVSRLMGL